MANPVIPSLAAAVSTFGSSVTPRLAPGSPGEPEDQLRSPFEELLKAVANDLSLALVPHGEVLLAELHTKPDYAIDVDGLLCGHVELKAPGVGVDSSSFRGRNKVQFEKLSRLPNLLYFDGNGWALYRHGSLVGSVVEMIGDVKRSAADLAAPTSLENLLVDFLRFQPIAPTSALGLAELTAGLCHLMRDEVEETLSVETRAGPNDPTPFSDLASDWRALLFPDVSDHEFADYYAQTVTFAILLAGSEGEDLRNDLGVC